jgi:2'-5' RNA ligase
MTEPSVTLRSFIAVALPGAVQTEIANAVRELARALPGVRWSKKPENLHVTTKFLGPVAIDRLDAIGAALDEALADVGPFEIALRGWGAFPSPRSARVVFVAVDDVVDEDVDDGADDDIDDDADDGVGAGSLTQVAEIVEAVSERFGFPREKRRFTGHVTVGRAKENVDARDALAREADRTFGRVKVDEVHIYESHLGRGGSTYVLRHRALLNARAN